ncbi:MAG: NYN domain-containing protein [Christensenellaceae bacterium]|jgi:hypothetical protein|nr:NYN domain-containing protein [Christensenellaceae bacterium]
MNKPKIIVSADLGSLKITCDGFRGLVKEIEKKYEVVACKFYSYVAKRNRDYNEYIAAYGFNTELPSVSKRRNKLDTRQVIDLANIAETSRIEAVAIISGEGDILPVINLLKTKGIDVYNVNVAEAKEFYKDQYTGFIEVPGEALREGYTAPATKQRAPKELKPIGAPKPAAAPAAAAAPAGPNPHIQDVKDILAKYRK